MANIDLIKNLLSVKNPKASIHDLFDMEELWEFEDEILIYDLNDLHLDPEGYSDYSDGDLSDECFWGEVGDDEIITDDKRVQHGLSYINSALEKKFDEVTETVHMIKTVKVHKENVLVCFEVWHQQNGLGAEGDFENAKLAGVFKTYDAIREHYEQLGLLCDDVDYIEEKTAFILKNWKYSK